ncbi:MAG: YHS domain protein [Roseovarius sp.]|nr:YHS domain protein [Roseovarius sp.]MCY4208976.1 YHS domain protein [Roseovarius sp.]MCY4290463.1 YHS domain protein [Roseovarius sp.]MCY4315499.1 YHS domain protein [Roseovarius sp.]
MTRYLLVFLVLLMPYPAFAEAPQINSGHLNKRAISGYDVISYWNDGKPMQGNADISTEYLGAIWLFDTEKNKAQFLEKPDYYIPQYGGYCAYAASRNAVADIDPSAWTIWNDRLYLNFSPYIKRKWEGDIDANIELADGFWPELLKNR